MFSIPVSGDFEALMAPLEKLHLVASFRSPHAFSARSLDS